MIRRSTSALPGRVWLALSVVLVVGSGGAWGSDEEFYRLYREGRYAEAIPQAREALAQRERALGADHPEVALGLYNLGRALYQMGGYAEAQSLFERAARIRERALGPAHPDVGWTLYWLGLVHYRSGDLPQARSLLERALQIHERARGPNHPDVAWCVYWLGIIHQAAGDLAAAQSLQERAYQIRQRVLRPDHPDLGWSLYQFGRLQYARGDYTAAKSDLERALGIHERALGPEHPDVAWSLYWLGRTFYQTADYGAAKPLFERALQIHERARGPNHPDVAWCVYWLGRVFYETADYAASKALLERALRIHERALGPEHPDVGWSLYWLGRVDYRTGEFVQAKSLFERSLQIHERARGPNHPDVAWSVYWLGIIYWQAGDYARAKAFHERALQIREPALGLDHLDLAWSLNELGLLHYATGDVATARSLLERALQIHERGYGPNHPALAWSLTNLGLLLWSSGDVAAARPLYERALQIRERALGPAHPYVAVTLVGLARLLRSTGDVAAARPLYERALQIRERALGPAHPAVAASLVGLAAVLREGGEQAAAKAHYERALRIVKATGAPETQWAAALGLGRILEGEGRLGEALPLYREAVKTLEDLAGQFEGEASRLQYLKSGNRLEAYDALARLLLKLHELDSSKGLDQEAWAVLAARNGVVAAEGLAAARPKLQDAQAMAEAGKVEAKQGQALALERALREEQAKASADQRPETIQNLTTLLARTKGEYLDQVHAFLAKYPQYKTQFVDQQTVDPKALAKFADRFPAGTLAVQYFAAPDRLYLFVVAPGGRFQVKSQPVAQGDLYALVKRYRRHIDAAETRRLPWADDGSEQYRKEVAPLKELTGKLAAHLLGPIEAELQAHRNLILIPNDFLLYFPFHALTRRQPDGSVAFLAETHAVSYLTQLELVDLLAPGKPASNAPLLALANPDGTLPAASREVHALLQLRTGVTALEGSRATKAEFLRLAPQFPDLHMATHGVLDPQRPELSYLLMAGADEASQRLGIGEIAGLRLANGLAILSACETALGEQVPGAALITLAAAFSQAGAQAILASLWKVNDAATRDFMVAFHRALPGGGNVAALQQAQLAVLRNPPTAHPYYWAPFILIGAR